MTHHRTKPQSPPREMENRSPAVPYFYATPNHDRVPLIEKATNAWRNDKPVFDDSDDEYYTEKEETNCCDSEDEDSYSSRATTALSSRRVRRKMFVVLAILVSSFYAWTWYSRPIWTEKNAFVEGLNDENGTFGIQASNQFKDIIQVQELDKHLIPGGEGDAEGKRRSIFVGDVHGCKKESLHLLKKVNFRPETDHLICTGDVVAKGPDSAGVVDTLISLNASSVRGNHEDRVLSAAQSSNSATLPKQKIALSPTSDSGKTRVEDGVALSVLGPHHLAFLRSSPIILHVPAIIPPAAGGPALEAKKHKKQTILSDIYVVHAGLVPDVPIRRQDPFSVMNMRSIHPSTRVPSQHRNQEECVGWERLWGWYQDRSSKGKPARAPPRDFAADGSSHWDEHHSGKVGEEGSQGQLAKWLGGKHRGDKSKMRDGKPAVVIYGHDSPRSLNSHNWSKGLDSGCVKGEGLTASVSDAWGREEIVSVQCKTDYTK